MRSRLRKNEKRIYSRGVKALLVLLLCVGTISIPAISGGQEVNPEGWPVPKLGGLTPYTITVKKVDGVEKIVERFYTPGGGHVARISGNGKVFAYTVDRDQDPPIDYLLIDPDGSGKFTQKCGPEAFYSIPEWVSR